MTLLKVFSVAIGLALLAATAHVTVISTGGYFEPHAVLVIAVAAGVGAGALALGAAWAERRYLLASSILLVLLAGEAFGLLQTGERLIASREAKQAPTRAATLARSVAQHRVSRAEAALAGVGATPRLAAALVTLEAANDASISKAAERGCRSGCVKLLTDAKDAASREVALARADIEARRAAATRELDEARRALSALPAPGAGTGLADRLGVSPWALDLSVACLGSLGANGLGACLLAFGAHTSRRRQTSSTPLSPTHLPTPSPPPAEMDTTAVREHVARYIAAKLRHAPGRDASMASVHMGYLDWCETTGEAPAPIALFVPALTEMLMSLGVRGVMVDGIPHVRDLRIVDMVALPAPERQHMAAV